LRYYENLFIIHPNYEQEKIDRILTEVKEEIQRQNGSVIVLKDWGKRKLAYPIDKQRYGQYYLVQYETDNTELPKALERWMRMKTGILSCITVRLKERPKVEEAK